MKKQNALTLIEILVSTIILSLVFLGLLSLFISGRKYLEHSQSRMGGSELGKVFIDPLQLQVRQDTWNANDLAIGNTISTTKNINGVTYTATSDAITAVKDPADIDTTLRRVKTTIHWNED